MSLKTFLAALLVASATAQDYGSGYGGGSSGSYGGSSDSSNSGSGSSYGGSSSSGNSDMSSWGQGSSSSGNSYNNNNNYGSSSSSSSQSDASSQSTEIIVQVVSVSDSNSSLKYFPDNIQAPVGSIVQFQFHPKNHTITESSFAAPCKPLAKNVTTSIRPGIKSGFVPVTGEESTTPVYNVLINDTKPIWIYCGQTNHCAKGMSMVINQNMSSPDKTIEAYQAAAAQLPLVSANSTGSSTPPSSSSLPPVSPDSGSSGSSSSPPVSPPSSGSPGDTGSSGASTTTGSSPATFTGAANKPEVVGLSSLVVLLLAGVAIL